MSTLQALGAGGDLLSKRAGPVGSRTKPAGRDLPGQAASIDLAATDTYLESRDFQ
jgi:hypothetical protein